MAERTKVAAGEWASNMNPEFVQLERDSSGTRRGS